MAKRFVWVCPACGKVYNSESTRSQSCLHCACAVVYTGFTKEEFDQKTPEQKQWVISNVKSGRIQATSVTVRDTSLWIKLLDTCVNLFLVIGVLASLIGGIVVISEGELIALGLIIFFGGVLVSYISATTIKILLSAASDLKYIRNYYENKR